MAIIVLGMAIGWLAQFVLARDGRRTDWTLAFIAGLGGSFVGGLLASLLSGDGLAVRPSGIIGSVVGALLITGVWQWYADKKRADARRVAKTAARSGRHH